MGDPTIAEKAAAGDFSFLVEPLDYKLLEQLPDEGTNIGGLYQIGETVEALGKKFPLGPGILSGRLRAMHIGGLTRKVRMVGGHKGRSNSWQKTVLGKEVLEKWQATQK